MIEDFRLGSLNNDEVSPSSPNKFPRLDFELVTATAEAEVVIVADEDVDVGLEEAPPENKLSSESAGASNSPPDPNRSAELIVLTDPRLLPGGGG